MRLYALPKEVSAFYIYKGIRLSWSDIDDCQYYVIYLNLDNDPKNGSYKTVSGVIETPNSFVINNNLIRERTIRPYIVIAGFVSDPSYTILNIENNIITLSGNIDLDGVGSLYMYGNIDNEDGIYKIIDYNINGSNTDVTVESVSDSVSGSGKCLIGSLLSQNDGQYGPFTIRIQPRKTAIEIARRLDVLFKARYKDAALARLWHRRRHGERCSCWDKYESTSADVNCPICYGVGFKGGYVGPEDIYITYIASPHSGRYDSRGAGTNDSDRIVAAIANMDAYMEPNDIIIDNLGTRYRILSIRYSSIDKTVLVSQSLQIEELPKNHIVYKLGE